MNEKLILFSLGKTKVTKRSRKDPKERNSVPDSTPAPGSSIEEKSSSCDDHQHLDHSMENCEPQSIDLHLQETEDSLEHDEPQASSIVYNEPVECNPVNVLEAKLPFGWRWEQEPVVNHNLVLCIKISLTIKYLNSGSGKRCWRECYNHSRH